MTKEEEKYTTLDTEQCKWWVNTLFNMAKENACNSHNFDDAREMQSAQDKIITALEQQPSEDCISRAEVQKFVSYIQSIKDSHNEQDTPINYGTICDLVIRGWKLMELPSVTPKIPTSDDCVSRQAVIDYLHTNMAWYDENGSIADDDKKVRDITNLVNGIPPVTPTQCIAEVKFSKDDLREICNERIEIECTHGTCKDCKHWKDSDGAYRRGVRAESKCPINIKAVYEGNFYCAGFEKRNIRE